MRRTTKIICGRCCCPSHSLPLSPAQPACKDPKSMQFISERDVIQQQLTMSSTPLSWTGELVLPSLKRQKLRSSCRQSP